MRLRLPASRQTFRLGSTLGDVIAAVWAPILALAIRDAMVLDDPWSLLAFWAMAFIASAISFAIFGLHQQLPEYFSTRDAINIVKAVVCADLLVSFAFFTFVRLEGIPRSTLIIHALILVFAVLALRLFMSAVITRGVPEISYGEPENVLLLSEGPVSSSYINLVEQSSSGRAKVVAVVDDHRKAFGRAIAGVPVTGPLRDLDAIIREFAVHGVEIDKLLVAGSAGDAEQALETFLSKIRARHKVEIAWLPSLTGLWKKVVPPSELSGASAPSPQLPAYFSHKRQIDICVATASLLILCPLLLAVYVLTLVGVGAPAIFWQRRLGQNGRKFSVLKFRTLRAPYDSRGLPVREDQRLTRVGRFLRRSHLDELLQLVNVLTGDMSLVGPRPLLPADQPEQPSIRLSVPPGMTGWAQINGGVLLSPLEKDRLDEWYIRNASFALDLRILLITVRIAIFGQTKMQDRAGQALPWHREGQAQT